MFHEIRVKWQNVGQRLNCLILWRTQRITNNNYNNINNNNKWDNGKLITFWEAIKLVDDDLKRIGYFYTHRKITTFTDAITYLVYVCVLF